MERTILVVEDSPTQAERLRLLLEGEGCHVEVAPNGRAGLERVALAPPDLIISDVVMPEMDGYEFCRAVKSVERLRRIPFVLLTERNTPADIIKGFERGADNFITKPFEDDQLLERLRRIFEHLELRRQGHLDVEITLNVGGRRIVVNADKQQMIELLFATLEELVRLNGKLAESQRTVEEYARSLETKVQERTQQLLQTEKVATMGQLLAGVAHELNNPLSVVVGHATLLARGPEGAGTQRAQKIVRAAERCSRIVKNFLALARQHPPERQVVSFNDVVREAVELLAYPLRVDGIQVDLDLAADLPPLWADPNQLHQVVVNLVTNAHHALRGLPQEARRLVLRTRVDAARRAVQLDVADTGLGIPREVLGRIFEPFFTTKPAGQGTGLGLSLCKGIVEGHGGTITVESRPGAGATFTVLLPVQAEPQAEAVEERPREAAAPAAGRRILVVDDEASVGDVLAEVLKADGHSVDAVTDGLAALEMVRRQDYDLIVTDIRMPGLDGPGLYRELARARPDLTRRVVFVTGDTLSPEVGRFLDELNHPTIAKPFNVHDVLRIVRQALR